MMVSDMFTSCNDFEISKKISFYASYAAVYANEPSLDKETEIATYELLAFKNYLLSTNGEPVR